MKQTITYLVTQGLDTPANRKIAQIAVLEERILQYYRFSQDLKDGGDEWGQVKYDRMYQEAKEELKKLLE